MSEGISAVLTATAADADGEIASYTLDFGDGRRVTRPYSGVTLSLSEGHTFSSAGHYTAVLTVFDDIGDSTAISLSLDVTHPAPQVTNASASFENGFLNVTYAAHSPYGPLQLELELNGSLWKTADAEDQGTYSLDSSALAPGNYTLAVFVSDGTARSLLVNRSFHVAEPSQGPSATQPPPPDSGNLGAQPSLRIVIVIAAALAVVVGVVVLRRRRAPPS